jgi:hypothetical protein
LSSRYYSLHSAYRIDSHQEANAADQGFYGKSVNKFLESIDE